MIEMARGHLDDLLAFPAVGREHSFTKAAAKLGVSQSALSHTIRELEARLWRSHGKPQQALRARATKIFCHLIRYFLREGLMGIKLHYNPLSTFSRRVLIALAEKQIPHELVVVDMAARQHRQQPYLSLNPYGRVPTLEEDGFVLFESTAILNYLEAIRPAPPLVPADAHGRALVDMHMKLCDLQLTRYSGTIIFPKRFLPKERWNAAAMAEAKAEIEKHLAILDKHLADKTYLVGEQFSLADVCYMPFLEFLPLMEIAPPTAVAAWSQRLLARPSAAATRPEK